MGSSAATKSAVIRALQKHNQITEQTAAAYDGSLGAGLGPGLFFGLGPDLELRVGRLIELAGAGQSRLQGAPGTTQVESPSRTAIISRALAVSDPFTVHVHPCHDPPVLVPAIYRSSPPPRTPSTQSRTGHAPRLSPYCSRGSACAAFLWAWLGLCGQLASTSTSTTCLYPPDSTFRLQPFFTLYGSRLLTSLPTTTSLVTLPTPFVKGPFTRRNFLSYTFVRRSRRQAAQSGNRQGAKSRDARHRKQP